MFNVLKIVISYVLSDICFRREGKSGPVPPLWSEVEVQAI